jgi:hypothetical protein
MPFVDEHGDQGAADGSGCAGEQDSHELMSPMTLDDGNLAAAACCPPEHDAICLCTAETQQRMPVTSLFVAVFRENGPGFFEIEILSIHREHIFACVLGDVVNTFDGMAVVTQLFDDQIDVYHARQCTGVLLREAL